MTLKTDIFDALKGLVGNRCHPDRFVQGETPRWPAIRYSVVGGTSWEDLCGDGGEEADDVRIQLDWVAESEAAREALTPQIRAAMTALGLYIQGRPQEMYDAETKTFRATADWIAFQST
jgi:hypothetical protein